MISGPPLPIRLCELGRSEAFPPPLLAALCSPNLLVALRRIVHFQRLISPVEISLAEEPDRIHVQIAWPSDLQPPPSLILTDLLFYVMFARSGTREHVSPMAMTATTLPIDVAPYEDYLKTCLTLGPAHRVTFSRNDCVRPFLTSNEPFWETLEPELNARLAMHKEISDTTQLVRRAIIDVLPNGEVSFQEICRRLGMSRRTLQRRLAAEGTRFKALLNATRKDLAHQYLFETDMTPTEISALLGFDEPNSFYRAFRAWTGTSPRRFRIESPP
ncbi:AraC-type DNA-binding protein [Rhizobium sp. NFR07]|nr:AraC-type DNA-binding protein [Rhizobium sp. NFR07]